MQLALCLLVACCLSACARRPAVSVGAAPTAAAIALSTATAFASPAAIAAASPDWQDDFGLARRTLASTGKSRYFILTPGYQLILASQNSKLTITVLDQTRQLGDTTTRVVEEREEMNGAPVEVSRNYFAIDPQTGDVFYFGEEVDLYANGQAAGHGGAWLAYQDGNQPGLAMPGTPVVGMKYYQELAPGVAEDRARIVSTTEGITTRGGSFENCLLTQESSKIEIGAIEYKTYCPGIGLVQDEEMTLASYNTIP
jgi:hypothetical protein